MGHKNAADTGVPGKPTQFSAGPAINHTPPLHRNDHPFSETRRNSRDTSSRRRQTPDSPPASPPDGMRLSISICLSWSSASVSSAAHSFVSGRTGADRSRPYTMDQKEEGGPFLFSLTVQDAGFGDDLRDFPPLPVFSFTE